MIKVFIFIIDPFTQLFYKFNRGFVGTLIKKQGT